jgi:SAM-dependent methyltransferase
MSGDSPAQIPPTDPRFYGEGYYATQLHSRHWFRNNRDKFRMRWENALRLLRPSESDVLLELGCATGEHTLRLAPMVARAVGVDFSPDAIRIAREKAAAESSKAEFLVGDVADLSAFAAQAADKLLALDLVEHIEDAVLEKMLAEAWRILKPGGRLVIYTPSASHYVERLKAANFLLRQLPGHIAVRDGAAYGALLSKQAWAGVELEYLPSSYPLFGWLDRVLMRAPLVGPMFRFRILLLAIKP